MSGLGPLVGGAFSNAYRVASPYTLVPRGNGAIFSTSGTINGWNPLANGAINAIVGPGAPSGSGAGGPYPIYLGGEFTTVTTGTQTAGPYLAESGLTIGSAQQAAGPNGNSGASPVLNGVLPNGPVTSLIIAPGTGDSTTVSPSLFVGGSFTKIGTTTRNYLAKINFGGATTPTPATLDASWVPRAGEGVTALAKDTVNVLIGGDFKTLGGVERRNIAAIGTSGVTTWNPGGTNGPVNAVAKQGGTVYFGGDFNQVNGAAHSNVAAADAATGALSSFGPNPGGVVTALGASPTGVYVGSAAGLSAYDPGTGDPLAGPWGADGPVSAIAVDGTTVYVGGLFANAGGQPPSISQPSTPPRVAPLAGTREPTGSCMRSRSTPTVVSSSAACSATPQEWLGATLPRSTP